jgi:pentapeptide MXKDX repeat protein
MPFFLPEEVEMNKISVALLSCCLALTGYTALAQDKMDGGEMNKGGMSMEKSMSGDSMKKDSMKMESSDKKMMKKEHKAKHTMKHKKTNKQMHKDSMEPKNQPDAMQRMQ